MHHRPAGPPLTVRVTGAFTRWGLLLRALIRVRGGRLLLAGVVTTAVTALVLVVPVVSGLGAPTEPLALDSSSSTTASPTTTSLSAEEGSPVVMGVDGRPIASSSFADTVPSPAETAEVAPGTTDPTQEPAAEVPAPRASTTAARPPSAPSTTSASGSSPPAGPSAGTSSPAPSSGPAPEPSGPPVSVPLEEPVEVDDASDLLALLDAARAGCAPLAVDGSLADAARAHSAAMRDAGALVPLEDGPAGSIAQGGTDADDVLAGWLADPTGQATILDCGRGSVGIGLVDGAGGPWWTLLLA